MSLPEIYQQFLADIQNATWYEYVAVVAGIVSVWFSRKEHILVYPIGLVNTIIYIYISFKGQLLGEAAVNFYYTVMSLLGWWLWSKKDQRAKPLIKITASTKKEWISQLLFFLVFYAAIFIALTYYKKTFSEGAIPWADALAAATAFTGMWLMTKKKLESWYWWIATNIVSIPLYFSKHYVLTSLYYIVLLILAIFGLIEWNKRKNLQPH